MIFSFFSLLQLYMIQNINTGLLTFYIGENQLTTYATFFLVALLVYKPNLMLQAWKYRLEDLVQGVQVSIPY